MAEKTIKYWNSQIKTNQSFLGKVLDICDIAKISQKELRDYWLKSEYGLIYILDKVRKNKTFIQYNK